MATPPRRAFPDGSTESSAPPTRLQRWRKRYGLVSDILSPQRIALALVALVLLLVGLVGGWAPIEDAVQAEDAQPGTEIKGTPFDITVGRFRVGDELKGVERHDEDKRYIFGIVDVTVSEDSPVDSRVLRKALVMTAPGVDPVMLNHPRVYRGNDGLGARMLPPDLKTPLVLVWDQQRSAPAPTEVELSVYELTYAENIMDGSSDWGEAKLTHRLTVPVTPLGAP